MITTHHRLDGSVTRSIAIEESVVQYLAGGHGLETCAWCGAQRQHDLVLKTSRIEHLPSRGQPCPLGQAVEQFRQLDANPKGQTAFEIEELQKKAKQARDFRFLIGTCILSACSGFLLPFLLDVLS